MLTPPPSPAETAFLDCAAYDMQPVVAMLVKRWSDDGFLGGSDLARLRRLQEVWQDAWCATCAATCPYKMREDWLGAHGYKHLYEFMDQAAFSALEGKFPPRRPGRSQPGRKQSSS